MPTANGCRSCADGGDAIEDGVKRSRYRFVAEHGIRCNAVLPGALDRTPNHDRHPDAAGRERTLRAKIPLGRTGTPDDIAPMVTFLCSDEARYANGGQFVIDGGVTVI